MNNNYRVNQHRYSWCKKLAYVIAAFLFLMLGIIGLLIPIIPGVIFLVAAAMLLARVSERMDRWVRQNQFARHTQAQIAAVASLDWPDKIKVTLWYTASAIIKVLTTLGRQLNKLKF